MLDFFLDISEKSKSNSVTPNSFLNSLPFTVISCGEYYAGKKYFTKRDQLDTYLLLVTLDGKGKMLHKGQTFLLKPGTAIIIDCNTYQEYSTQDSDLWHFHFVHFKSHSMSAYNSLLLEKLTPVTLQNPDYIYDLMEELYNLSFTPNVKTYIMLNNIITNTLTEMVCSISLDKDTKAPFGRNDINILAEFIRNNFKQELHIDDFMKLTNLSKHYLIHTFKRQIGLSPCQYMHMCRINHAQTLLATTDMTISEISERVGYNSTAVFIRHFKSFNKTTPQKFRNDFLIYLP